MFNLYSEKMEGESLGSDRTPMFGSRDNKRVHVSENLTTENENDESAIFDLARVIVNRANRRRRLRRSSSIV